MLRRRQPTVHGNGAPSATVAQHQAVRVLIADTMDAAIHLIHFLTGLEHVIDICGASRTMEEMLTDIQHGAPHVVLMSRSFAPDGDIAGHVARVRAWHPEVAIAVYSRTAERTDEEVASVLAAGADEWVTRGITNHDLVRILWQVGRDGLMREQMANGAGGPDGGHVRPPVDPLEPMLEPARRTPRQRGDDIPGQVFMVYSPKGGVGKSTTSINLAMALAQETGARVALVDMDLNGADISVMLNIWTDKTLTEVGHRNFTDVDSALIDGLLVDTYENVRVLQAPSLPRFAELITLDHIDATLRVLRAEYDYIVADLPPGIDAWNLDILQRADFSLMLTDANVNVIGRIKRAKKEMVDYGVDMSKIGLVINARDEPFQDWGVGEIENEVRMRAITAIPYCAKELGRSLNSGKPAVVGFPNGVFARAIREVVGYLLAERAPVVAAQPRKRWLAALTSR